MAEKGNGLKSGWKKIYGHQFDDKEMMDKYREGWERIWGKKDQETEQASRTDK